jgi:Cd2+/Zn2+-exporting ATPase
MGKTTKLTWRVEGMDCAACVAKVTRAVERLPGVSEVQVNLMAERLTVALAPDTTPAEGVAHQVEILGYTVVPLAPVATAAPIAPAHLNGPDDHHDDRTQRGTDQRNQPEHCHHHRE